jgi:hypothetical protein
MIAHRREGQTVGDFVRVIPDNIETIFPERSPLAVANPKGKYYPGKGLKVSENRRMPRFDPVLMKSR